MYKMYARHNHVPWICNQGIAYKVSTEVGYHHGILTMAFWEPNHMNQLPQQNKVVLDLLERNLKY